MKKILTAMACFVFLFAIQSSAFAKDTASTPGDAPAVVAPAPPQPPAPPKELVVPRGSMLVYNPVTVTTPSEMAVTGSMDIYAPRVIPVAITQVPESPSWCSRNPGWCATLVVISSAAVIGAGALALDAAGAFDTSVTSSVR